jgi:hypothetical protein
MQNGGCSRSEEDLAVDAYEPQWHDARRAIGIDGRDANEMTRLGKERVELISRETRHRDRLPQRRVAKSHLPEGSVDSPDSSSEIQDEGQWSETSGVAGASNRLTTFESETNLFLPGRRVVFPRRVAKAVGVGDSYVARRCAVDEAENLGRCADGR